MDQSIFGQFYGDPVFLNLMNMSYYPVDAMIKSAKKLKDYYGGDFSKLTWGDYQPVLTPTKDWPLQAGAAWKSSVGLARDDLAAQLNSDVVSRDDSRVPGDRCALLDASVRKCFTTAIAGHAEPGIPMVVDVRLKRPDDATASRHDIQLSWTYDLKTNLPVQLNLTMVCPSKADA